MKIITSTNAVNWLKLAEDEVVEQEVTTKVPSPEEAVEEISKPTPMGWDPKGSRAQQEAQEQMSPEDLWKGVKVSLETKETKYGKLTFVVVSNTAPQLKDKLKDMKYKAFNNRVTNEWTWSKIVNAYKSEEIDPTKLEAVKAELDNLGADVSKLDIAPVEIAPTYPSQRGVAEEIDVSELDIPEEMIYWHSEMKAAKELSPKDRKAKYTDIIKDVLEQVGDQTELDATSEKSQEIVKSLLKAAANFHNYSFWNSMMIAIMKPGSEYVASEGAWKIMGRRAKEKATRIPIMFPIKGKKLSEEEKENMDDKEIAWATRTRFGLGSALAYQDTEPISEDWVSKRGRWKGRGPFEPPEWQIDSNEATDWLTQLYEATYKWATEVKKFRVEAKVMDVTGGYASLGGKIAINDKSDGVRKITTLFHEIAHQLIHFDPEFSRRDVTKQDIETDAEATAYVVASHYHIESPDAPIYLAAFGADKSSILGRFNYIRRAALEMFEGIDAMMERLNLVDSQTPEEQTELTTEEITELAKRSDGIVRLSTSSSFVGKIG